MNLIMQRLIAVIILVIPGFISTYGFLLMKNSVFDQFDGTPFQWWKFLLGLVMFAIGIFFIGGWIFFRDRKRNYVAPRFRDKSNRPPRRPRPERPTE